MHLQLQKQCIGNCVVRPVHGALAGVRPVQRTQYSCVVVRAQADDDLELEARLAQLKRAKGQTPDKEGSKSKKKRPDSGNSSTGGSPAQAKQQYDYTNETVYWEGGPAAGDLAFNVALGATLVALPLSIGAAARSAFVKYKFTDKRVSVKTDAPWESE